MGQRESTRQKGDPAGTGESVSSAPDTTVHLHWLGAGGGEGVGRAGDEPGGEKDA